MTPEERREIADALTSLMSGQRDPLAALRSWGIEDLLREDPQAALAPLFRARGRFRLGAVPLEQLLDSAHVLPLADAEGDAGDGRVDGVVMGADASSLPPSLVVLRRDGSCVRVAADGLDLARVSGLDPAAGLVRVVGAPAHAEEAADARPLVVRLLAEELCGLTASLLEQAREHTSVRTQFGAPLSALQVVRHKLVDVHVELAAASALVDASWAQPFSVLAADTAKVWAGQALRLAASHCPQVCGGIGFTEEFGMYDAVRRGHLLDALVVGATTGTAVVGRRLAALGKVPRRPLLQVELAEVGR